MKKYGNKRIAAILLSVLVAFCFMPFMESQEVYAESYEPVHVITAGGSSSGFESVAVTPSGDIYTLSSSGNVTGYTPSGAVNGFTVNLPSAYCGNICSSSQGILFSYNSKYDANKELFIINPTVQGSYKKVYAPTSISGLAADPNGNLYCVSKVDGETTIYRAKAADVAALENGADLTWSKSWQPSYTAPSSDGKYYPQAIAADGEGNIYIVDKGSSAGSDCSVSGIFKFNINTGDVSTMLFSSNNTVHMTWVYGVTADTYGNVAVIARNSNSIAVFRCDSIVADFFVSVKGYGEGIASDPNGKLYYPTYGMADNSKNGLYRVDLINVAVTDASLTPTSKTIKVGGSFTLSGSVLPADASNPHVTYTTSDSSVATVSSTGKVTGKKPGTATITMKTVQGGITRTCSVTVEKIAITPTVTLSATKLVYNGKVRKPTVTVKNGSTKMDSSTYSVTYADGRKNVGKYKVTVKMTGNYTGTASKTFTIKPKKAVISKATPGKKQIKVTMSSKVSATGGSTYQIKYRVKGSSSWKTTTTTSTTKTIKNLKKGKVYQIKVRAYKKVDGTTYYGAWSKVKTTTKVK